MGCSSLSYRGKVIFFFLLISAKSAGQPARKDKGCDADADHDAGSYSGEDQPVNGLGLFGRQDVTPHALKKYAGLKLGLSFWS